jgi:hypothetical protein
MRRGSTSEQVSHVLVDGEVGAEKPLLMLTSSPEGEPVDMFKAHHVAPAALDPWSAIRAQVTADDVRLMVR